MQQTAPLVAGSQQAYFASEKSLSSSRPGSWAAIRAPPTKYALTPASFKRFTSPGAPIPLSVMSKRSAGTWARSDSVVSRWVSKVRKSLPQASSSFKMRATDLVTWRVGTRVEVSSVSVFSKRYAWLRAMQSVESFSAAKRIRVICEGKQIEDVNASHVRWAVDNRFLIVIEHSR